MERETPKLKELYDTNKFYYWILGGILLALMITNIAITYFGKTPNYELIGKTWVIGSSFLTSIYTYWFWHTKKGKGRRILHNITSTTNQEDNKVTCSQTTTASSILLVVIALINIVAIIFDRYDTVEIVQLGSWGSILLSHLNVFVTLLLMIVTYYIFCSIDKKIIDAYSSETERNDINCDEENGIINRDFESTFINTDRPGFFIFVFLEIYFLVILFITKGSMELFFYGAIAFQMLFASVISANTEITDTTGVNVEVTDTKQTTDKEQVTD